jgi:hypothetical protein
MTSGVTRSTSRAGWKARANRAAVNVSAYTYDLVKSKYKGEYRGKLDAKGKGEIDMYFVVP